MSWRLEPASQTMQQRRLSLQNPRFQASWKRSQTSAKLLTDNAAEMYMPKNETLCATVKSLQAELVSMQAAVDLTSTVLPDARSMSVGDTAASSSMAKSVGDPAASSVVNTASSVAVPASNAASSSVAVSASSRAASASGNHPGTKLPPRSTSTQSAVDFEFPLLEVGSYHTLRDLKEEKSNGLFGTLRSFDAADSRWVFVPNGTARFMRVKGKNIR